MKRFIAGALLTLASCGAMAQDYTGIWRADEDPSAFVQVTQRGQQLVITALDSDGMWDAYIGFLSGNQATVATIIGRADVRMTVTFTSESLASATLNSCAPLSIYWGCAYAVGARVTYRKIF